MTINGVVSYELEPETGDDRHVIEIMKGKVAVTMKQSNKGGIIFELERVAGSSQPVSVVDNEGDPTDLTNVGRLAKSDKGA